MPKKLRLLQQFMGTQSETSVPLAMGLRRHFGRNPVELPVVEQNFAGYERANFQLALNDVLSQLNQAHSSVGIVCREYEQPTLAKLAHHVTAADFHGGPVEYVNVPLADGQQLPCLKQALLLTFAENNPLAILIHNTRNPFGDGFIVEVTGPDRILADRFLEQLAKETQRGRAFKGKVLSVERDCRGGLAVQFHRFPKISRDDIILPEELLQRIERHTVSFSCHAERLRRAGRHLKRGILLHGSPGTGKTMSAMYLASRMPERSVIVVTGAGMGSIETACKLARMLEPATVILEDADLIGTERGQQMLGANALLFELLNQMDGLADDADILFILTTNRPDKLEPALAARPGRIDQAIEVPPPDADCRSRLIDLYGKGLTLKLADRDDLVRRTEGVSAAFLRELIRKAAVYAAESQPESDSLLVVTDQHIAVGLHELLVAGGTMTQSLLAARSSSDE